MVVYDLLWNGIIRRFDFVKELGWTRVIKRKLSVEHCKQYDTKRPHVRRFSCNISQQLQFLGVWYSYFPCGPKGFNVCWKIFHVNCLKNVFCITHRCKVGHRARLGRCMLGSRAGPSASPVHYPSASPDRSLSESPCVSAGSEPSSPVLSLCGLCCAENKDTLFVEIVFLFFLLKPFYR